MGAFLYFYANIGAKGNLRMKYIQICLISALLAACSEKTPSDAITGTDGDFSASSQPIIPAKPEKNYTEVEDKTYFYVGAVSEEDKNKGRAVGDVFSFRYFGTNKEGQHILALVTESGQVISKSRCGDPCSIIKSDNGERIPYDTSSIIGSAFQDALNGHLVEYDAKGPSSAP